MKRTITMREERAEEIFHRSGFLFGTHKAPIVGGGVKSFHINLMLLNELWVLNETNDE